MVSRAKSDAQLDAEAAARDYGLRWLIIDLRRALWMEHPERLHAQHTSKTDDELDERGWPKDADEGGIGLPFSPRMHRFLRTNAGPSSTHVWDRGPDPQVRPAMASIVEVSEWCHARHLNHLRAGHTRSLCAQLVFQVAYLGQEPEDVAWLHGIEPDQIEGMLVAALRKARVWRNDVEQRLSREPGTDAPINELRVRQYGSRHVA